MAKVRSAIDTIELMRAILAFLLIGAFIGAMGAFTLFAIPDTNKDILTYMVGQLSGMATTVLGFFFINKVGQDALDAKRSENTGRSIDLAHDAIKAVAPVPGPTGSAEDPLSVVGPESTSEAPPVKTETEK